MTLTLHALTCGYRTAPVLRDMSVRIEPGTLVSVIGRNGAGKSTLMRTIAGLQRPLEGQAQLNSRSIHAFDPRERAQRIAVVTTDRISSPGLYARDVVELGRQPFTDWTGRLKSEDHSAVQSALVIAKAGHLAGRLIDSLSDGERQRIMIARALAQNPELMILDEITAFLDFPGRVEVMALLRREAARTGTIVLISSHDLELSLELADLVWLIDRGALSSATTADHISSGRLARTFDTADVRFDPALGRFRLTDRNDTIETKSA